MEQTEFDAEHPARRKSDNLQAVSNADIMDAIKAIQFDIRDIKSAANGVRTAFVLNDLSQPDFDGHRAAHRRLIEVELRADGIKMRATEKILMGVIGFILLLLSTGVVDYIKGVVK